MKNFTQPWKLTTFACGMAALLWGVFYYKFSDWDIGVSILMGSLTYLTAPYAAQVVFYRRWRQLPFAILAWLVTVDISYYIYHGLLGNEIFRWENFVASTCLYWLCGFIWLYNGSLQSLWQIATKGVSGTFKPTDR